MNTFRLYLDKWVSNSAAHNLNLNIMLRTNTNKYKSNIKQYLLDCINYERTENCHDKGKLFYCSKMFIKEWVCPYEYRRQGGNVTKLLAGWLSGLAIDIDYEKHDIIEVAKKLHETDYISDKKQEIIIQEWFNHLAYHLNRIFEENQKDWFYKNYLSK